MGHFRKNMISIFLTDKCNMDCKYCYLEKQHKERDNHLIDFNFVKRGISDYFIDNYDPGIRYFGEGEPTLNYNMMKDIKIYADSITDRKVKYELQTNGVFNEEIAEWIRDNLDIVYISLDGPKRLNTLRTLGKNNIQNIIEKNISILMQNSNLQIGTRATISSLNVYNQKEIIDYFISMNIKIVFVDLIFCQVGKNKNDYGVDYKVFVDEFVNAREYAISNDVFYGTMFTTNFDEEVSIACRSCIPTPHLTIDGYVSCCDMCCNINSNLKDLIYGKYDSQEDKIYYDEKAIQRIKKRNINYLDECNLCSIKQYCAGGCLGEALNESGNMYGIKEESCKATKYLWDKLGGKIYLPYLHP